MTITLIASLASGISTFLTSEITVQAITHQHLVIYAFAHVALLGSVIKINVDEKLVIS